MIAAPDGANITALRFAFERLGALVDVTDESAVVSNAERVVLPGAGAAGRAMRRMHDAGLVDALRALTQPVLGICLGMQLLFQQSAEGPTRCLDLVPGTVNRLASGPGRPVPHMGWNQLLRLKPDALLHGIADREYAYFVHSYAAGISEFTLASTDYGTPLSAVIRSRNFYGVQFSPERSGRTGARLLENFLYV